LPMKVARDSCSVPANSALERSMHWFNWVAVLVLVTGSMMGCAQRGVYLGSSSQTMPAVIGSTEPLLAEDACDRCGGVSTCRCRVFPGARLLRCLACGSGCENVYWGEWTSDPPEACDGCMVQPSPPFSLSGIRVSADSTTRQAVSGSPVVPASYNSSPPPLWKTQSWSGRR
jgi:hypothetical protein